MSVRHASTVLRSLRPTGVTPRPRYYGRSDSCPAGCPAPGTRLPLQYQAGLPSSRTPSCGHSVSNHPSAPGHRFSIRLVGACLDGPSGVSPEPAVVPLSHQRDRLIPGFAKNKHARALETLWMIPWFPARNCLNRVVREGVLEMLLRCGDTDKRWNCMCALAGTCCHRSIALHAGDV